MNIKQNPEEKIKSFAVRLRVSARKCGCIGKKMDNVCLNNLKKCTIPHISALQDHCLPGISFKIALIHAYQFERKREVELDIVIEMTKIDERQMTLMIKIDVKIFDALVMKLYDVNDVL